MYWYDVVLLKWALYVNCTPFPWFAALTKTFIASTALLKAFVITHVPTPPIGIKDAIWAGVFSLL